MNRKSIFTLTETDHRRAMRLQAFANMRRRRVLVGLPVLWIAGVGFFSFLSLDRSAPWSVLLADFAMLAIAVAALLLAVSFGLPLILIHLVTRRRFRQEKTLGQPATVTWDDEFYSVEHAWAQSRVPWRGYMKWRENRHLFIFLVSDYNWQILPKRALTKEQTEDIRGILASLE